ncbi:MAG: hypothetical protein PHF44_02665 [Candidatus Pacebacteria bacterium]|nr:hypothetical protein [Candidatus Paceibacterota bacterium]
MSKSAINSAKLSKGESEKRGTVFVVFAMDTEGPVTDKKNKNLLGSWGKVDFAMGKLFDRKFRNQYKDSFGGAFKISWFFLNWTGFKTNPVKRDFGYHKIQDHYIKKWGDKIRQYGDGIYWHYHHPSKNGVGNEWNIDWFSNNEYFNILNRMVIDRKYFPSVFRAGGTIENNDSSLWLEQWIPFDYSSRASKNINWQKKEADGRLLKEVCDWTEAPRKWGFYNPSSKNYQKEGCLKRKIFRCLDFNSSVHSIQDSEIGEAFLEAEKGKDVVLAFFDHDFRDIAKNIAFLFFPKLKKIASMHPKIKFKYENAKNAATSIINENKKEKINFKVKILNLKLIISSNSEIFGSQPYLAIKFGENNYKHYSLDVIGKNIWQHALEYPKKKIIFGIAANNNLGENKVLLYKYENSRINPR